MKKIFTLILLLSAFYAQSQVVISQAYGGGGNNGATLKNDFIELFNRGNTAVVMTGWSVQYNSATAVSAWQVTNIPTFTLQPGQYFLIQQSQGAGGTVNLPTPDATGVITMSGTTGKVALVTNQTALSGACSSDAAVIDIVGFGPTANCAEGTPAPVLTNPTAAIRNSNGCTDTNNNSADFTAGTPNPRNSTSAFNVCGGSASPALTVTGSINGFGNVTVGTNSPSQTFNLSGANLTGFPGTITITAPSTDFQVSADNTTWGASATVAYTSATLASTPVYVRFTPQSGGLKAGNLSIAGGGQSPALTVALNGTGVATNAPALTIAGSVNDFGTVTVLTNSASQSFTVSGANLTGFPGVITIAAPSTDFQVSNDNATWAASVTIPYTSATLAATTVYVRFTPQTAGLKTGNVSISGGGAAAPVTIAVSGNGAGASAPAGVRISQVYGSGGNASATYKQDFVELYNPGTTTANIGGWSLQYASVAGPATPGNWSSVDIPAGTTIGAGKYFLIGLAIPTGPVGADLPVTPDLIGAGINVGGGAGKIALVNTTTVLNGATACSNTSVVDLIGFSTPSTAASCAEGTPFVTVAPIDNTTAIFRKNNGCTDTDNNLSDFEIKAVAPRNSTSAANVCGSATTPTLTTAGTVNNFGNVIILTNSASQSFTVSGANLTGFPGVITITAPSTDFQVSNNNTTWAASTTIPYTAATLAATTVYVRFTPQTVGVKSGNIAITGGGTSAAVNVAVSGTGINAPVPTLTVAGTVNDFGTVVVLTNSASQNFTVSGANLTGFPGVITITAPSTDFQVSNDNSTWTASTTIPYTAATLAATMVYVRFTPQTQGVKTGNISITGGGTATAVTVAVSGNGISATAPQGTATALTAFGNVCLNTASSVNSFTINASNLTTADVVVGALAGYAYSIAATGPFTPTLTLTQPGGTFTQQVFVQFTPTAVQPYNGNISVTGGGLVTTINVAATGNGVNTIATVTTGAASAVTITGATAAATITLTGCTAITAYGIEYSTINNFPQGTGTAVASTNLAAGAYTSTLTGLAGATTYYYRAYATNAGGTAYGALLSFTTATPPPASLTAGALAGFGNVCLTTVVGPNSFTITGANLTTANVVVGPLAGYTFSTSAAGTYTASLTLTQPGGTFTQQVFVKFAPTATQSYNGNIPVTGGGAAAINVVASGSGINTPPSVTTVAATTVTVNGAQLNGSITAPGCTAVTSYGIEYSSIAGFANGTGITKAASNLTTADFSVVLAGLAPNTTYYYKAFAQNANGKTYGTQQSFTTGSIPDGFVIYSTPVERGGTVRFSLSTIKPGHYAAAVYNSAGQKVFKKEMLVQLGFVTNSFVLPSTLPSGVYILQIENYEFKVRKQFIIR